MSQDPNKKVTKSFQCREALWQKFEQMSKELECSVDYLINDAMKQYARQRGYGATAAAGGGPSLPPQPQAPLPPPPLPTAAPPPPPPGGPRAGGAPPPPAPPPKRTGGGPPPPPPPPPGGGRRIGTPPPLAPSRSAPPPKGGGSAHPAGMNLTIHYQGEAFQVTKDRFIIGRGKQTSDLTIKDPNVSRQHAMIEFSSGQYYIVDMGSTNGVEFNGQRVQRKVINEGDTFRVCDHELVFTYD